MSASSPATCPEGASPGRSRLDQWLHGRVLYPAVLHAIGEGILTRRLHELEALQWRPESELRRLQGVHLRALFEHARAHSPFYAECWPSGALPPADEALAWLAELPMVTKADLQESLERLRARAEVGRVSRKITGGSTGQAVTVLKDRRATAFERAAMWLGYGWRGVRMGDRVARFWGAPFATKRRWLTRAADLGMHRIRFSAFAFDDADLEGYWRRCIAFQPDYLHGYVSMLEAFAGFLQRRGYDGRQLALKSIVATSEVLTAPQRALLESTFGAPVQIEYGCGELGPIAYDCAQGGLHLMASDVVTEILTPDGRPAAPGETGEVVVTDLHNRAMPLVRYRLGDFAVPGTPCPCGRGLPTLAKIWGRAYDFVQGPDGRRYHGEFFMYLFEDLRQAGAGIQQFQVTQLGAGELAIDLVLPGDLTLALEQRLRALLDERLPGMRTTLRRVDRVERTASGKMQLIRNRSQPAATDVATLA